MKMKRFPAIEGLRAYLAVWVLVDHVMGYSGYYDDGILRGLAKLLAEGRLAVDLFMAISGFVIFRLLDRGGESYGPFICRRFFRLYPLFIVLFVVAIPLTRLDAWGLAHSGQWMTPAGLAWPNRLVNGAWEYWQWNIPLHLTLLHGLAPDAVLGGVSTYAFLPPAWSISLEWQFYLVAPLAFGLAGGSAARRLALCALCAGLFYAGMKFTWSEAFFPTNIGFFFVGAVSYYAFKSGIFGAAAGRARDAVLPVAGVLAAMLFLLSGKQVSFIPFCLWMIFFGLLCEHPAAVSARWLLPWFENPVAQYFGRISYSIYLSHYLVIIVMQGALAWGFPELGKLAHFGVLLTATAVGTAGVSALLYRYVEEPGMKLGAALAARMQAAQEIKYAVGLSPVGSFEKEKAEVRV
jgi:peptidoglycan/LPS O-acetylase OafA/YrhL